MEDDGKDEDLAECGEMREECSACTGLCDSCVTGTFPLSNVNGMKLDQLVGGGGFPSGRCDSDSHMWVDCKEVLSWGGGKRESMRKREGEREKGRERVGWGRGREERDEQVKTKMQ